MTNRGHTRKVANWVASHVRCSRRSISASRLRVSTGRAPPNGSLRLTATRTQGSSTRGGTPSTLCPPGVPVVGVFGVDALCDLLASPPAQLLSLLATHGQQLFAHLPASTKVFAHLFASTELFAYLLVSTEVFAYLLVSTELFAHLLASSELFA